MDWNDVRHFLALARLGSVRAAGASLGVSHSTVARRVDALETELGVRLFDRHRDGYLLTDAGRDMLPRAERIEQEMAALERGLAGRDERLEGRVRITLCDPWVSSLLVPELAALADRHPGLEIELGIDSRKLDLSKREADIAVRALAKDASPAEHLLGRRLVPLWMASYVAVAHGARRDPEIEGSDPRWAGFGDPRMMKMMVETSSYPDLPVWGAFGTLTCMVQAAHAGVGLAMLPTYVGDPDPALRRLTEPDLRHMADLWLLSHPDLRDTARLQLARETIAEALRRRDPLFQGQAPDWTEPAPERPADAPIGSPASPVGSEEGSQTTDGHDRQL